jgi:ribosomal protein S18 acetylase RimI-like enzyme
MAQGLTRQEVEWCWNGKFFAHSSAIEISIEPLNVSNYLARAAIQFSSGECGEGWGLAPSPDIARSKAVSELFERVAYLKRLDIQMASSMSAESQRLFKDWLEQASIEQCLAVGSLVYTTCGFGAHHAQAAAHNAGKNEWIERCIDGLLASTRAIEAFARSGLDNLGSQKASLETQATAKIAVCKTGSGYFTACFLPGFGTRATALSDSKAESREKALGEAELLLRSKADFRSESLQWQRESLHWHLDLSDVDTNFCDPPRIALRLESSQGESRVVSLPCFADDTLSMLRTRIRSLVSGNLDCMYPRVLPRADCEDPIKAGAPLLALLGADVNGVQADQMRSGTRILTLGVSDHVPRSDRIVLNNFVYAKATSKVVQQGGLRPSAKNRSVRIRIDLLRPGAPLPEGVSDFLMRHEAEARFSGAWYTPLSESHATAWAADLLSPYVHPEFIRNSMVAAARCSESGQVVGAAVVLLIWPQPFLHFVAVDAKFRGQNIGSSLVHEASRACAERASGFMFAYVSVLNMASQRLLERHGFMRVGDDSYVC